MDNRTFIATLSERLDRDPQDIALISKSFGQLIAEKIKEGDTISMPGFGSFEAKLRPERETVHPASGVRMLVPPKLTIAFKPSAILKQRVRK